MNLHLRICDFYKMKRGFYHAFFINYSQNHKHPGLCCYIKRKREKKDKKKIKKVLTI